MGELAERLSEIVGQCSRYLSERDEARERALKKSRDIIREAGRLVTLIVSGDAEKAGRTLPRLEAMVREYLEALKPYPELYYSGSTYNAVSEYVEAAILYRLVSGEALPGPEDLSVPPVPYLQGLGDVVGELRRLALDMLRRGDLEGAWRMLEYMEDIYLALRSLDYPDSLLPGVRRKTDIARRLVDETKALLLDVAVREELSRKIDEALRRLGGG